MNLLKQEYRQKLLEEIKKPFNIDRKAKALYRSDIQNNNIKQHVIDELKKELYSSTVKETPIVSTINLQSRVVTKKACVYTEDVIRSFEGVSDEQQETILNVYADGGANIELNKCNKKLIYDYQTILGIFPRNKKLMFKKYELHQLDVVPNMLDNEIGDIYIMSVFDREPVVMVDAEKLNTATGSVPHKDKYHGDKPSEDSEIATKEDYKKQLERFIVWSNEHHFLMNGHGQIVDLDTQTAKAQVDESDIVSPLKEYGLIPYVDISREKDGSFWNTQGSALSDFTVQFNCMLSDLRSTIKMSAFNVGVLKAPSDLQPDTMTVGASMMLKLPTDDPDANIDFDFKAPSNDINSISDSIDKVLNYFITTQDLDSSVVNSKGEAQKFTSGWDRFLALTEKRESTKEDYQLFKGAEENEIWAIVKAWLNVLDKTETLDRKYHTGVIADDATCEVEFEQADALLTEKEKIENVKARNELSLESRVTMLMKLDGITEEKATEYIALVDKTKESELPIIEAEESNEES